MDQRDDILQAAAALADTGVIGLIWFDPDLIVDRKYGRLAAFVGRGTVITEALICLVGLETAIAELSSASDNSLELPSVSIKTPGAPAGRLDIRILWSPAAGSFLLTLTPAMAAPDLEIHLAQQVRARLMAERDATAMSKELARANRDLEEFASIISHDLNTPLRALRYLAGEAEAALSNGDIGMASDKLGQLQDQSRRLSAMQRGLLDYSVAGRKLDIVSPVDLRALVQGIIDRLPPDKKVTILIDGDWPTITTAAAPLDLVLRNLVNNAIKHHDLELKTILISGHGIADAVEISVADDGPGIDPAQHAAVLLPFRRLGSRPDEAGAGIGLALVKRTIDLAGGGLQIISNPSEARGTTFRVSWPKQLAP